ncbi:PKD domain-containing protein [uncultured Methanospirillum sp.]|uniref:PKD domain-containing protein n=1 Tax=uncultured Methanospirillum sp. TaxID=262503 RepID=UPI0029C745B3|nr:PKD domain-containing protein [uncultured Methanospirillum sp.]
MNYKKLLKFINLFFCISILNVVILLPNIACACPPYGNFVADKPSITYNFSNAVNGGIIKGSVQMGKPYTVKIPVSNPNEATNPAQIILYENASESMPYEEIPPKVYSWSANIPVSSTSYLTSSYSHNWKWLYLIEDKNKLINNSTTYLNEIGMASGVFGAFLNTSNINNDSTYDAVHKAFGILKFFYSNIDAILGVISAIDGKYQVQYYYKPKSSNVDNLQDTSVLISISPEKPVQLCLSMIYIVMADILAYALSYPLTWYAVIIINAHIQFFSHLSGYAMNRAIDPDPNYWDPVILKNYSTLGFGNVNFTDIPNSNLKDYSKASLDLVVYEDAYNQSYVKYLGATEVNDTIWEKNLLIQCYYYLNLIKDKNDEVLIRAPNAFQDLNELGFNPTKETVETIKNNISISGLPQNLTNLLKNAGYQDSEINSTKEIMLNIPDSYVVNYNQSLIDLLEISNILNSNLIDQVVTELGDNNTPPYANFTSSVYRGYVPLLVQFNDTSLRFPNYWYWDFGDNYTSTEQNPIHIYNNSGNYSVNLTVTNITTGSNCRYKFNAISVYRNTLVANYSVVPTSGITPLTVNFTDTSEGYPSHWYWDFGDNYTSTEQNPTHIYHKGNFSVNLTICNNNNITDSKNNNELIHVVGDL